MSFDSGRRALDIASLAGAYRDGLDPAIVIRECHARIVHDSTQAIWITTVSLDHALQQVEHLKYRRNNGELLPLFGIPFAVKDNIDAAGLPTTAGCPAFAFTPQRSATVVERLQAAGAILLGKTNLDQFATGLVGTRSPYGIPSSVFNPAYISGGSSSGSAVAVAAGLVSFALGTDTAGSGRVPAAFNNIVGLKPTRGRLSTQGVLPACRTLDCVAIFAGTVADSMAVYAVAAAFDEADAFSRAVPACAVSERRRSDRFTVGVPGSPLEFFGDEEAARLFEDSVARLERVGGTIVAIDFTPFREASALLYGGPWVAERLAAVKSFAACHGDDLHPITREIILGADRWSAVEAFEAQYRLAALIRRADAEWAKMDMMLLPTTGTIFRIDEVLADPIRLNNDLGLYTNFTNLMDLSAVAVPAGFRRNGLPFGVTVFGRAFADERIADVAAALHRALKTERVGFLPRQ
jgi:allophanate hydrolase